MIKKSVKSRFMNVSFCKIYPLFQGRVYCTIFSLKWGLYFGKVGTVAVKIKVAPPKTVPFIQIRKKVQAQAGSKSDQRSQCYCEAVAP